MTTYLYYAGMARDRQTEQIGLAVSVDGRPFERVNGHGLIVPCDRSAPWKSLRVCNPTVLRVADRWLMFYQGVAGDDVAGTVHAIGLARSADGIAWTCDDAPFLTIDDARAACAWLPAGARGGVIEPAVLVTARGFVMYFVAYVGTYRTGTYLLRATCDDGASWQIDAGWVLSSSQFGRFRLHYPEAVATSGGVELWFTLFDLRTSAAAVCAMTSRDGRQFDGLRQVLPPAAAPPRVERRDLFTMQINGATPRGMDRVNQVVNRVFGRDRNYFGFAHSHLESVAGVERLYYHAYHRGRGGRPWMDIGRCETHQGSTRRHATVLAPSSGADVWDGFFVADPFAVTLE